MCSCWHYAVDALPRFEPHNNADPRSSFDLKIPIGLYCPNLPDDQPSHIEVTYSITSPGPAAVTSSDGSPIVYYASAPGQDARISFITPEYVAGLVRSAPRQARPYLDIQPKLNDRLVQYAEATIGNIAHGSRVAYSIVVRFASDPPESPGHRLPTAAGTSSYVLYASMPSFTTADRRYEIPAVLNADGGIASGGVIIYYREENDFHHFRIDYAAIGANDTIKQTNAGFDNSSNAGDGGQIYFDTADNALPAFNLQVGQQRFAFPPADSPWYPNVNRPYDYVTLAIPKDPESSIPTITWNDQRINMSDFHLPGDDLRGVARVMFIHFRSQGLNDLFAYPFAYQYPQPQTYMQITMNDSLGLYSSRPDTTDDGKPDGYIYPLRCHDTYKVKSLWAFTGGVLSLLAHDCPSDLSAIRGYVAGGLMQPVLAGFGGHALPYLDPQTNEESIAYGRTIMANVLQVDGSKLDVYYLDQRLYKQQDDVIQVLKEQSINYIVVESDTGYWPFQDTAAWKDPRDGRDKGSCYLWQDERSGRYLLYNDADMRDQLFAQTNLEVGLGKLGVALRQKLIAHASTPQRYGRSLLIYADDADKAGGCGWFDGGYAGSEYDFVDRFDAALEWIAAHPWIQAVQTRELAPDKDCAGRINMQSSVTSRIDPEQTNDCYNKPFHFDAWYDNWTYFPSVWLGQSLGKILGAARDTLRALPVEYQNKLSELAQLSFSVALQESFWNKQPLETDKGWDAHHRHDVCEPEDFIIAASLQLGNALVYTHAAIWATWAKGFQDDTAFLNDGPGLQAVMAGIGAPDLRAALHWDRDILESVILYNRQVLVVMDQNGGRITHIFARVGDEAYCLSGTMKAYQFLLDPAPPGPTVSCDGEVLQNTVYTPNHAYVACDVQQAQGVSGWKYDPRTGVTGDVACHYPDSFNSYDFDELPEKAARWTYRTTGAVVGNGLTISAFRDLLRRDRDRQVDASGRINGSGGVVHHPDPGFHKTISLNERTIRVQYHGTQPGHTVANEFCVDLYRELLQAGWQSRSAATAQVITFSSADQAVSVTIALKEGKCQFNADTIAGSARPRLHRVLTDCVEIEAPDGGDFAYEIRIGPP